MVTMQVATSDTTTVPAGRRVLVVGRISPAPRPACAECGGFQSVTIRAGARLITVHCTACVVVPVTAGPIEDIQEEADRADDYEEEPEGAFVPAGTGAGR
ncbi:hypothetical protein [Streptomyces jumonjinensis]|uniref:hypothetical protein n=1 Tax=Streptomyces jumonjinensis TaxID=1945 RepID=UPI00378F55B2